MIFCRFREFQGYKVLKCQLDLPSALRKTKLIVPYKYASINASNEVEEYEYIKEPSMYGNQGYVNRLLIINDEDWSNGTGLLYIFSF